MALFPLDISPYEIRSQTCEGFEITTMSTPFAFVFRQLFDKESSTYTYLLGDPLTQEAVLIDPVIELAPRDSQLANDLNLNLKYVVNTHVHADHITGTGLLKKIYQNHVKSVISTASGADGDVKVNHGDNIHFGVYHLQVRSTPGHTNGCVCFVFHEGKMVFTGDTLLIRGCGRTDLQGGSAESLYNSVHAELFVLPEDYLVYPAHDYKGFTCSSIGEEKKYNPRLTQTLDNFKSLMSNLNLANPKMIGAAVPANRACGLYNLPDEYKDKFGILFTG